jgi:undecaprenol kinase
VKKAKDIAAGGVLVAAVASVIVGVIIFGPRILSLLIN